jgi:hypothetical protein
MAIESLDVKIIKALSTDDLSEYKRIPGIVVCYYNTSPIQWVVFNEDLDDWVDFNYSVSIGGTPNVQIAGGSVVISGTPTIRGNVGISGTPTVNGTVSISGTPTIDGTVIISGTPTIQGDVGISGTPTVVGTVSISGTPTVQGDVGISGTPTVQGSVGISGTPVVIISSTPTVQGNMGISGTPTIKGAGLSVYSTSALDDSNVIKNSAGVLYGITGINAKASAQYIQIHNTTAVPADTAVPLVVITVPASSNFSIDFGIFGLPCSTGISWSNSTTLATKTLGSADVWLTALYS